MIKARVFLISGLLCLAVPSVSYAQEAKNADDVISAPQAPAKSPADVPESLSEEQLARKVVLAEEMHKINPVKEQVDRAVNSVARQLPEAQRPNFLNAMYSTLNYKAIERISIDAMVETYTLPELEAMVEYYSKPEARSASEKIIEWAGKVQPEIVRMIDKAMIKARTGQ